jgi:hypothetical protein
MPEEVFYGEKHVKTNTRHVEIYRDVHIPTYMSHTLLSKGKITFSPNLRLTIC